MRSGSVLLLLVLVTLAGCAGLLDAGSEPPTGTEAQKGFTSLESVSGLVEYQYRSTLDASNTTLRIRQRPREGMTRQHILSPPNLRGDVTVTNGSVSWLYDASTNEVTRISLRNIDFSDTSNKEFVKRVFENLTDSDDDAIVTDPLLPVGPVSAGQHPPTTTADLAEPTQFSVAYLGSKTVAGRLTHGVTLDPVNVSGTDQLSSYIANATYWFDAEYFFPLETTTVITIDGNITRNTRVYHNVTFNLDLSPGTFQFDPPPNATVRTPRVPQTTSFDTVAGATANVSFDVATAEVPDTLELDSARVSREGNQRTVHVNYENATHSITIATRSPPYDRQLDGERVSLGAVNATRVSSSEVTIFGWNCDGLGYTVRGDLAPDVIESIAGQVAANCAGE